MSRWREDLEKVRKAADVVEWIGAHIPLMRIGAWWCGPCPFCRSSGQKLHVYPKRLIWHCFHCGAGGDVFSFIMAVEKVDFLTAFQKVATRLGIVVSLDDPQP